MKRTDVKDIESSVSFKYSFDFSVFLFLTFLEI